MTRTELEKYLDTRSNTWIVLKKYLENEEKIKVERLLGEFDHDKSSELKGAIKFIRLLLKVEEDARKGL